MELILENFQAGIKKESSGIVSANLSLQDCILDDLRATLDEEESREGEEEVGDGDGSTRETSVDIIDVPEKQCSEQRIRRYVYLGYIVCIVISYCVIGICIHMPHAQSLLELVQL